MNTEVVISLLGFLTAAAGAIRWLIHVYWAQATKIEELKKTNTMQAIKVLETTVDDLRSEIRKHRLDLLRVTDEIKALTGRVASATNDVETLMKTMGDYIEITQKRIAKLESSVVELGKRMVMIKGGGGKPDA
jgi:predicted RNase H-like nuclease (RuvC/YqgF family)